MTPATDEYAAPRRERMILGFTGDLETTVAVPWLAETYGTDVIAVTVDLGQRRDLEEIRDRALALGARRAHVLDAREEFAGACLLPALRAGVLADGNRRLAAAVAHAAIAGKLVEIAAIEQADRVAHAGVTSAARIAAAVHGLQPGMRVVAAASEWGMSRDALLDYAAKRGLRLPLERLGASGETRLQSPVPPAVRTCDTSRKPDPPVPMACRSVTDHGEEDKPSTSDPHGRYEGSASSSPSTDAAPHAREAAVVEITFRAGIPVALNGVGMPLLDLIGSLDFLAGKNGVGRREPFETPAVPVLAAAHQTLRNAADAGELNDFSQAIGRQYAEVIEHGRWFGLLRAALDAYVDRADQVVNGLVRVRLYNGAYEMMGCRVNDAREDDGNAVVGAFRYGA